MAANGALICVAAREDESRSESRLCKLLQVDVMDCLGSEAGEQMSVPILPALGLRIFSLMPAQRQANTDLAQNTDPTQYGA